MDYYNVTSIYFLMLHPLAGVRRLYTLYTLPLSALLNLQITKFKLTLKAVMLQHGWAHVVLPYFPYSLRDQVLKSCLVLNPYWTNLWHDMFSNVLRGRTAESKQRAKKEMFPSRHHRNTHTHTHMLKNERACQGFWKNATLKQTLYVAGSSSKWMAHFQLFHGGTKWKTVSRVWTV